MLKLSLGVQESSEKVERQEQEKKKLQKKKNRDKPPSEVI